LKQTLYDRDETKLINRIVKLRESLEFTTGEIQRPVLKDEVYSVDIFYEERK
jgi:hypothetical protein